MSAALSILPERRPYVAPRLRIVTSPTELAALAPLFPAAPKPAAAPEREERARVRPPPPMPATSWDVETHRPKTKPPAPRKRSKSCGGTSLGWWAGPSCEHCRPAVAAAVQAKHRDRVAGSYATMLQMTSRERGAMWLAELFSTGEARTNPETSPYHRPSRAIAARPPKPRGTYVPTAAEVRHTHEHLATRSIRKFVDRTEWASEVWCELLGPPGDVAEPLDFEQRLTRAIWRAEACMETSDCPNLSLV